MKIIIMHQTVANHDAIGNDIELMYNLISKKQECKVYAQNQFNSRVEYINELEMEQELNNSSNLIIYHHSVYWEKGEQILDKFRGEIVIRYHNITPPEFFQPYNAFHYTQCADGREQTIRFAEKYKEAFWIVDSNYNSQDINNIVKSSRIEVCPPFNKIEQWAKGKPDESILKDLIEGQEINLLFVGRVAPNKGHIFLTEIMKYYCMNYNSNIKLRIIGKFDDGLLGYNNELLQKIDEYRLNNNIEFIGEINDSTLMSYYLASDFFICVSEHEGFCVPIPEAQYFHLPILAMDTSAVPETLGENQVILENDAKEYAAAIHIIYNNQVAKDFLRLHGKMNFDSRFTIDKISKKFIDIFNNKFKIYL